MNNVDFFSINISVEQLHNVGKSLLASGAIFLFFYATTFIVTIVSNVFASKLTKDRKIVVRLIRKLINLFVIFSGIIAAMNHLGIDVRAFILQLGLIGFAVGYAFKDVIANALSGMMIILYRPFKVGDFVTIGSVEGEIVNIDMRHTSLRKKNNKYLVPNSKILSESITVKQ